MTLRFWSARIHRTRFFCAIGLSLWAGEVSGCQKAPATSIASQDATSATSSADQGVPSGALSEALRARLRDGRFQIVGSITGLPLGVRGELATLFGPDAPLMDIAEPAAEFQMAGRPANRSLPLRRMVAAGCSADFYCLLYYERGGTERTWRVALFHWTPDASRLEWASTAPGGLATIDAVRKAILSGAINGTAGSW